ncbi:16S rRNA (uracil(1498)-N(3))-methyltransferase [Psychromicrobium sp. YIM B11713]|uniref:16S rRNA (uracil(1498)-N(3))-methyltransferase n=1 Tax=Psychromicrobium sp. YIM B11713 TaxID=3145233 RepID=UPI00374F9F13
MTNPIFFVDPAEVSELTVGEVFELGGTEGHHAATVKRLTPGEAIDLVDGKGLRLRGTVTSVGQGALEVSIEERLVEPVAEPRLVLVQALAKDGRDELAIETATELGVDAIVPWQADRSIVRWKAERAEKALAKWRKTVQAAAKQARRARVPEVLELQDSTALAKLSDSDQAGSGIAASRQLLVLHEEASSGVKELSGLTDAEDLLLIVGPEGGISARELELFASVGAKQLRLGAHVLRSSTAGPVAIALLSERLGRW